MREPEYMGFHWKYPMTFILMGINLIVFVFNEICTAYFPNLGSDVGYYCAISAHGSAGATVQSSEAAALRRVRWRRDVVASAGKGTAVT